MCEQNVGVGGHWRCERGRCQEENKAGLETHSLRAKLGGCTGYGGEAWETPAIRSSVHTASHDASRTRGQLNR